MTHAKDYIDARSQHAKDSIPGLKAELEKLIANSKAEFIDNGEIAITDKNLSERISRVKAQNPDFFQEFYNWLEEFGWALTYKTGESPDNSNYPHRPTFKTYYIVPLAYLKNP